MNHENFLTKGSTGNFVLRSLPMIEIYRRKNTWVGGRSRKYRITGSAVKIIFFCSKIRLARVPEVLKKITFFFRLPNLPILWPCIRSPPGKVSTQIKFYEIKSFEKMAISIINFMQMQSHVERLSQLTSEIITSIKSWKDCRGRRGGGRKKPFGGKIS